MVTLLLIAAAVPQRPEILDGTGPIWLDSVICSGTENRLIDCRSDGFGVHDCAHNQDAGVICQGEWLYSTVSHANISLANNLTSGGGRIRGGNKIALH